MASSSSSSSLGRISVLKSCIESSSAASSSGGSFYYYQKNRNLKFNPKKQQQMRIVAQGCSTSNVDGRAAVNSDSSSSMTNGYLDTVFGTELKKKQKQQRQDNGVIREIKVGIDGEQQQVPKISADKLDEWMEFSVPEIVKNIGDAPLLVQIYSSMSKGVQGLSSIGSSSSPSSSPAAAAKQIPVLEKMKADAKSWTGVTKRWEEGSPVPDGIILVEQLKAEDEKDESEVTGEDVSDGSGSTKTWGVVIQGRGVESASSCYILKTCRVGSSLGFCTHFCLARAKCFGESADLQLKNSWLLGH
ncbi:hypothetical protein MKW94_006977 [Papaver nudicaule]|uniref:DUF7804 domain-containing protein n=1 Tax=Papaver nudicaule TaxID=74823 RepID=A0AA42B2Z1_PAPNU|nr:hypothetical protein [Papaver nudicaule]